MKAALNPTEVWLLFSMPLTARINRVNDRVEIVFEGLKSICLSFQFRQRKNSARRLFGKDGRQGGRGGWGAEGEVGGGGKDGD